MMKAGNKNIIAGLAMLASGAAFASAFQLQEQSVTSMGTAYAGTAAISENANSNFYNVGSLTHTRGTNLSVAGSTVITGGSVTVTSATDLSSAPFSNDPVDHPGVTAFIPSMGVAHRLNNDWFVGFNIASPFGLKTEYSNVRDVRYVATRSEVRSYDFTPSVAYQRGDWSLGAGYNYTFVRFHLDSNVGNGYPPDDGYLKGKGQDWTSSYKIGLLYDMSEQTRFGLQYRTKARVGVREGAMNTVLQGNHVAYPLSVDITLPETATFSVLHHLNPRFSVLADVSWTRWDRVQDIVLHLANGADQVLPEGHWHNAMRFALGVQHAYNDRWVFRVGTAYDRSPISDANRTARIPDNDRIWVGAGSTFRLNKNCSIDAGYDHIFIEKGHIDQTGFSGTTLVGDVKGHANVVGVQANFYY